MEPPLARHPNHYLVSRKSKNAEEILRAMNEGIRLIREDGTLDKIMSDISYQTPLK
jgi:ABC-type amino acid transport substrate-binding protein